MRFPTDTSFWPTKHTKTATYEIVRLVFSSMCTSSYSVPSVCMYTVSCHQYTNVHSHKPWPISHDFLTPMMSHPEDPWAQYWPDHEDVMKWKHFPRYWPLCGEHGGVFLVTKDILHFITWRHSWEKVSAHMHGTGIWWQGCYISSNPGNFRKFPRKNNILPPKSEEIEEI